MRRQGTEEREATGLFHSFELNESRMTWQRYSESRANMTQAMELRNLSSNTLPGFVLPLLLNRQEGCKAIMLERVIVRSVVTHSMVAMMTVK